MEAERPVGRLRHVYVKDDSDPNQNCSWRVERSSLPLSKVEWTGFAAGLDLKFNRKRRVKGDPSFLA